MMMDSCKLPVKAQARINLCPLFISFEIKARASVVGQGSIKDSLSLWVVSMTGPKDLQTDLKDFRFGLKGLQTDLKGFQTQLKALKTGLKGFHSDLKGF
jgi:hypothetical protein